MRSEESELMKSEPLTTNSIRAVIVGGGEGVGNRGRHLWDLPA